MIFLSFVPFAVLGVAAYKYFKVSEKAEGVATLYNISRSEGSSVVGAVAFTVATVAAMCFYSPKKENSDNVKENDDGTLTISYKYDGKKYRIIVPKRRGPSKIMAITNIDGDDISERLRPFVGPSEDFHGCSFTPEFFGEEEISFDILLEGRKTFKANETILI